MYELQVVGRLGETSHSCFEMKGGRLSAAVSRLKACARDSSSPVSEGALCLSEVGRHFFNSNLEAWPPYTSLTKTAAKPTPYGAGYTS